MTSIKNNNGKHFSLRELMPGIGSKAAIATVIMLACLVLCLAFSLGEGLSFAEAPPAIRSEDWQKGSYVNFGRYPKNDSNTPEPIEWQVLENDGKTALLVSKYCLDSKTFNNEFRPISWRDCSLRKWLNGPFLRRAFTRAERSRILESIVFTEDNEAYNMPGCGETHDKLFCLSINEANKYFVSDEERERKPTNYAESNGLLKFSNGGCCYWLRNPGYSLCVAAAVTYGGTVIKGGIDVHRPFCAVLPALRVEIDN